jgi:hypothetical protein
MVDKGEGDKIVLLYLSYCRLATAAGIREKG